MSRYRRHKDTAHPGVVAALMGAGALVTVLEGARWAGGGRKQQTAGAPDLYATLRGTTVALEVKSPGASKARREDMDQKAFSCAAALAGLPTFQVSTPLEALAALGCTAVEARRGLIAAGFVSEAGTSAFELGTGGIERMLSEARQRLQLAQNAAAMAAATSAFERRQTASVGRQPPPARAKRGPTAAYVPPRTYLGPCSTPGCEARAMPSGSQCTGCFLEGAGAKESTERSSRKAGAKETP